MVLSCRDILKILFLQSMNSMYFHLLVLGLILSNLIYNFQFFKSSIYLVKFIPKYFIIFMILWMELFSYFSLWIVCWCIKIQQVFVCWFSYPITLLNLFLVLCVWWSLWFSVMSSVEIILVLPFKFGCQILFLFLA